MLREREREREREMRSSELNFICMHVYVCMYVCRMHVFLHNVCVCVYSSRVEE